jgi:hypothetical protein
MPAEHVAKLIGNRAATESRDQAGCLGRAQ